MASATKARRVLITGADGYLGRQLVESLAEAPEELERIVAMDIRPPRESLSGVEYMSCDIRAPELADAVRDHEIDTVVHLAAVVTPGRKSDREFEYSVDVLGTANLLEACVDCGVRRVIITSSGASYGYHADNPQWLVETDPLRGNESFAYSHHKRLVEEMLARYRIEHPGLEQLIFRPGTILGATTANQITDIFDKSVVIGLAGCETPFVLIWDQDVVACLRQGLRGAPVGIYNMAGDGVLGLREMAAIMGKPFLALPVAGVRGGLAIMKRVGVGQYGPEQIDFLRYRPVLSNRALKEDFGYVPEKTTRDVFEFFLHSRREQSSGPSGH